MNEEKVINPQKVYEVEEAAKVLGINEQTLLEYLRDEKIIGKKVGSWKILGQNLIDFLSEKTYLIVTKQGVSGHMTARNKEELLQKLSTGHYGVLPVRGRTVIKYTPENIQEIIELETKKSNS